MIRRLHHCSNGRSANFVATSTIESPSDRGQVFFHSGTIIFPGGLNVSVDRPAKPTRRRRDGSQAGFLGDAGISARGRRCVIARPSAPLFGAKLAGAEVNRDLRPKTLCWSCLRGGQGSPGMEPERLPGASMIGRPIRRPFRGACLLESDKSRGLGQSPILNSIFSYSTFESAFAFFACSTR